MNFHNLMPPEDIRTWVGPFKDADKFIESGRQTFQFLKEYAGLLPSHTVLDAGCGCGRVAIHFLDYLDNTGKYCGFDICPEHIAWCNKNICSSFHNFHFTHIDVRKSAYNPEGKLHLKEIALPYPESTFDLIWAHSLFTHMLHDEIEHYLAEFARIIRPQGILYASYYLINDHSAEGVKKGTAGFNFVHRIGRSYTFDKANPEEGLAQDESWIKKAHHKCGFTIVEPILLQRLG